MGLNQILEGVQKRKIISNEILLVIVLFFFSDQLQSADFQVDLEFSWKGRYLTKFLINKALLCT